MPTAVHSCLLILLISTSATAAASAPKHDLVRRSCVHASYPEICLRTLSSYGVVASTPCDLSQAAVRVSLGRVCRASEFLGKVKGSCREVGALRDCVEQMTDSVDELSKMLSALQHLRRGADFRWQMSNVETWVSSALTNEDTCLDGFKEITGKVGSDVRRKITNVSQVSNNALYLINLLDD